MAWGATIWWIAVGGLVAAELATGTFYLLMLALGALAGAVAAHLGLGSAAQLLAASVIGAGAVFACYRWRQRRTAPRPAASNRDVILDVGEHVHVAHWAADGSARVHYRGASWEARFLGSGHPAPGDYVIRALDGNRLMLDQ